MEMIVQSIAEKIYVAEFSCGNTFNLEMVLLLNELKTLRFSLLNNRTTNYKDPPY